MQSIAQYLRDRLDPGQYQLLQKVSRGFTRPLFALDPETGRFECAAELDDEEVEDPSVLDALCVACELLEASGVSFDPQDPALEPSASSGTVELTFDFPDEDEDALVRFKAMLAENASADAGIHADYQKYTRGRPGPDPPGLLQRLRLPEEKKISSILCSRSQSGGPKTIPSPAAGCSEFLNQKAVESWKRDTRR